MKIALFAAVLLIASRSANGTTAYEALRVLGKQRGEAVLDKTIGVRGDNGKPQPSVWKIIVKDPAAKGGAKEYSVQGTRLSGESTPASRTTDGLMNMSQLNLDSDGVHQVAEREAKKVSFAYDHANYTLRAGSRGGSPVWEIQLVDVRSGDVATMTVAATNGSVLSSDGFTNRRRIATGAPAPVSPSQPSPYRGNSQAEPVAQAPRSSGSSGIRKFGEDVGEFTGKVGKHMARRGRQVGDFFYNLFHLEGRNTADEEPFQSNSTPPPPKTRNSDVAAPGRIRD